MSERSAKDVVEEMFGRHQAGDDTAIDDLVAADMVNHAAGPQGRDGLKLILSIIDNDLGPVTVEQHHLIGDGDLVAQHLTLHGTHRASTMPLLADAPASGRPAAWTSLARRRLKAGSDPAQPGVAARDEGAPAAARRQEGPDLRPQRDAASGEVVEQGTGAA